MVRLVLQPSLAWHLANYLCNLGSDRDISLDKCIRNCADKQIAAAVRLLGKKHRSKNDDGCCGEHASLRIADRQNGHGTAGLKSVRRQSYLSRMGGKRRSDLRCATDSCRCE